MNKFKRILLLASLAMGVIANTVEAGKPPEAGKPTPPPPAPQYATQAALNLEAAARITGDAKLPSGNKIGDTLTWSGTAWTPETKSSTGFVLLDANGVVIGDYDFVSSNVILEKNSIYYQLPVTSNGFAEVNALGAVRTFYTSVDCSGAPYLVARNVANTQNWQVNIYIMSAISEDFPNKVAQPIVSANKLYKQDLSQVISIVAISEFIEPPSSYCISGSTNYGNFPPTRMDAIPSSALILIEDLGITNYPTPFSIKAN